MDYLKLGAAAACLAAAVGVYWMGHSAGTDKVQAKWNQDKAARAQAAAELEARHRAVEKQWGVAVATLTTEHRQAQEAARHELETTIAGVESGALVLRDRFRRCEQQLSATTGAAGGADGGGEGGLSEADQRFFIRVGAECDAVVSRLTAVQAYIRSVLK
jgi:hypothetical protein